MSKSDGTPATRLEARLARAEERSRRLAAVGQEMLACFTDEGASGLPELRTTWVPVGRVERWRLLIDQARDQGPDSAAASRTGGTQPPGRSAGAQ